MGMVDLLAIVDRGGGRSPGVLAGSRVGSGFLVVTCNVGEET